jgi:hypothetical protein
MSALLAGLGDKNASTRKAYASALAYVVKVSRPYSHQFYLKTNVST